MRKDIVVGIDIGGTNSEFGLITASGVCIHRGSMATPEFSNPVLLAERIRTAVMKRVAAGRIKGIGLGAPNVNCRTGKIEFAPNLPWKGIVDLAGIFQDQFQKPCVLANDASVAARGEMKYGGAKDLDNFMFITLGTGLGSGLVAGKQLISSR